MEAGVYGFGVWHTFFLLDKWGEVEDGSFPVATLHVEGKIPIELCKIIP